MAWTPKDQNKLNRLKKESALLEQEQKKLMEDAAKLSGEAYQNAIKTIKAKGKMLTAMKAQKAILEDMVEDEEKIFNTKDKSRLLEYDIAGSKEKLKKLQSHILDSYKAQGILTHKELKRVQQKMMIQARNLKLNIQAAEQAQYTQQLADKMLKTLDLSEGVLGKMKDQAVLFTKALLTNPYMILLAGLALTMKFLLKQFALVKSINKEMGVGALEAKRWGEEFRLTNDALKLIGQDAVGIMGEIQTEFGNLDKVTPTMVAEVGVMSTYLGASSEHLIQVTGMVERLGSDTKDAGMNTIKFASALATSNKVAPGKVLEDIATNSKLFAEFGQDGGENIARAAVAARRLGLDLGSVASIADSLLDFETSIGSEMEASMLIGKQLNFNKARELALSGDLVGAAQDVVAQIGGQAELEQMNVIQRRALADSIGVSVEELSRLAGGKMTLEDPAENVQERLNKAHGGTQAAMTVLGTKMDTLTTAVTILTTATVAAAAVKMFSGKGNILKSLRGTRIAKSTGMLDKTKGLGRAINTSRVGSAFFGQPKTGLGKAAFGQAGKGALKRIPGVSAIFGGLSIGKGISDLRKGDKQKGGKNIGQGAGAIVGGALGTFLGPVGTMVGSAIGGWVGGKLGGAIGKWRENSAKRKAEQEEIQKTQEKLGISKKEESEKLIEKQDTLIGKITELIIATKNVGKNVATHVTKE